MNVLFVTGNQNKADHLQRLIGIPLDHQKIQLDEIQSMSLEEIVAHKVKQAYAIVKQPVLVEDAGIYCQALSGLPGPFIKFFVEADNGLENLCRMLDGFDDRRARAECVYGYYDGKRLEFMRAGINGTIAHQPRGQGGFGWDPIFCPEGFNDKTRAELSKDEYDTVYQLLRPVTQVRELLQSLQ